MNKTQASKEQSVCFSGYASHQTHYAEYAHIMSLSRRKKAIKCTFKHSSRVYEYTSACFCKCLCDRAFVNGCVGEGEEGLGEGRGGGGGTRACTCICVHVCVRACVCARVCAAFRARVCRLQRFLTCLACSGDEQAKQTKQNQKQQKQQQSTENNKHSNKQKPLP